MLFNIRHEVLSFTALALMSAAAMYTSASPARRGVMQMSQPDGTTINVTLHGDESVHYYISDDGCLLMADDDALYYASLDADDRIVSTGVLAHDLSVRSERECKVAYRPEPQRLECAVAKKLQLKESKLVKSRSYGLFPAATFPTKGSPRVLVLLVEYDDVKFTLDDPYDYFYRMLNQPGFSDYYGTGCIKEYFEENSLGQFSPEFDLVGPVKLPEKREYYGRNDRYGDDMYAEMMVVHACQLLDDEIDFSQYDSDGDGYVDVVFVYYAGQGEASGGPANSVWPHQYELSNVYPNQKFVFDGVCVDRYACSNEMEASEPDGMGTFVHEFSHVMGLPDLYALTNTVAFTPESWDTMDTGCYNNDARTPPYYSAYERYSLGWLEPTIIESAGHISMGPIYDNVAYMLKTDKPNEYFFLENRQRDGWDRYLPGHGMLVWHVDYKGTIWTLNKVNDSSSHQYVDLIEADDVKTRLSLAGDSFPGTAGVTSLTYDTTPQLATWSKKSTGFKLMDITETDGLITINVMEDDIDALHDVSADTADVYATAGQIHVCGSVEVEIYNVYGTLIYSGLTATVDVTPGVYIVKSADRTVKLMVK